jgi:RNase P subunit RPR2
MALQRNRAKRNPVKLNLSVQSDLCSQCTSITTTTTTTSLSSLSSMDNLVTLHCAFLNSKTRLPLGCVNSDFSKIKRVQRNFANLCYNRSFINFGKNKKDDILASLNLSMFS